MTQSKATNLLNAEKKHLSPVLLSGFTRWEYSSLPDRPSIYFAMDQNQVKKKGNSITQLHRIFLVVACPRNKCPDVRCQ